ncbi:type VI secretion system tube protein TssD [Tenacibaculum sp. SDUM215027]|uniref:type VI secretion system tube protein TssD n=1 Tax=Tenacibaculum sp. SDUM215027 TaxID=3422596 RepID=UPI003D3149BD
MYDDTFIEWIIANRNDNKKIRYPFNLYQLRDGKVVFYEDDFDGVELFQYNFQDGALINYYEVFDNQKGMYVTLTISPAMQDYRFFNNSSDWRRKSPTRYIKPWQESFILPIKETPYKSKENNKSTKKSQIIDFYYTDKDYKKGIKLTYGEKAYLVLESKNMVGEIVDLKLNDKVIDFTYNNERIKNNTIEGYKIKSDTDKIPVFVISEDNEELE